MHVTEFLTLFTESKTLGYMRVIIPGLLKALQSNLCGGILRTFPDHILVEKRVMLLLMSGNSHNFVVLIQQRTIFFL